jgi:RNA polymerase sigma-70 factor (ECF subfamily)
MGRVVNLRAPLGAAELDQIEACRRGDRQALHAVFTAHSAYLERLLGRVAGTSLEVDDLLQSTFMAAIEAFPRFRGEAQVRTWLARIGIRIAHDRLRSAAHRRRAHVPDLELAAAQAELASGGEHREHGERDLDLRRRLARLEFHLNALGAKKRIAFVLHVFEGLPLDEVAALTGAGLPATKSRVFWARRELLKRAARDPLLCAWAQGAAR